MLWMLPTGSVLQNRATVRGVQAYVVGADSTLQSNKKFVQHCRNLFHYFLWYSYSYRVLLTYARISVNWSSAIVTAGRGNTNATSGSALTMTVPAAPAWRGPVPLLPLGQKRIFPLYDCPARESG